MTLVLEPVIREHESIGDAVCPWMENPYALVSWWEMERFAASAFIYISQSLASLKSVMGTGPSETTFGPMEPTDGMYGLVDSIGERCTEIGLKTAQECVKELLNDLRHGTTNGKLITAFTELDNTIRREMRGVSFFHMPASQAEFYDQSELFGLDVNAKFPSIQYDMVESGNCYAMGRGTACVFHLMRIMEIGVQQFGTKLGVTLAQDKNWHNILDEINKAIKTLPPKAAGTVELSQASANLYAVKLAWRNEVMHPNDKYTLEEAKNLILAVRLFMVQLASII